MREIKSPETPLFRLGRRPDPWQPPDWSCAQPDGTFGNRFDDPTGSYRVLYASSQRVSCFVETLARFRPDLTLLAEFQAIEGEDDFMPLATVPPDWCDARMIGEAEIEGDYADLYAAEWVGHLRSALAPACISFGIGDLDVSVLQQAEPRKLTQLASLEVYEANLDGIYYRSRYGHNLENWALFEPFRIGVRHNPVATDPEDADLSWACRILGIKMADI